MAQGSPGTYIAFSRPEGLVCFAAALESGGTVVMLVLMVVLTSPAFGCVFRELCRSPRR